MKTQNIQIAEQPLGAVQNGAAMRKVSLRLTPKIAAAMRSHCENTGVTRIELIEKAVRILHESYLASRQLPDGLYQFGQLIKKYATFRNKRYWCQSTVVVGTKMSEETTGLLAEIDAYPRRKADLVSAALGEMLKAYPVVMGDKKRLRAFLPRDLGSYNFRLREVLQRQKKVGYVNDRKETERKLRNQHVALTESFLLALSLGQETIVDFTLGLLESCQSVSVTSAEIMKFHESVLPIWRSTGMNLLEDYVVGHIPSLECQIWEVISSLFDAGIEQIPTVPSDVIEEGRFPAYPACARALARAKRVRSVFIVHARASHDDLLITNREVVFKEMPRTLFQLSPVWPANANFL